MSPFVRSPTPSAAPPTTEDERRVSGRMRARKHANMTIEPRSVTMASLVTRLWVLASCGIRRKTPAPTRAAGVLPVTSSTERATNGTDAAVSSTETIRMTSRLVSQRWSPGARASAVTTAAAEMP